MEEKKTYQVGRGKKEIKSEERRKSYKFKEEKQNYKKYHINIFLNAKSYLVILTEKPLFFISLCILRDLPQQKIPRELFGGGDPAMF
jgi:hypothetical protein